ncbi:MAG: glycosyltransferase [Bacteroidetes bacterium]|nr:glycosyltransferase [Bacteroidota bacterium]
MPKVLRIINRLNLGGPTFNAALLTKYLAPEYETLLVAGTKMDSEESSEFICEQLGINYIQLPEMSREINFSKDRAAYQKIKKTIADFKPDIVHTHAAKAGTLGRLAAHNMKVPVIVHTFHGHVFHSYFNPIKTRVFLGIERYLAKRSSAIIAISDFQKEELAIQFKLCAPEKIKVVPLGFDLSRFWENMEEKRKSFRSQYFLEDDELAVGIIGRLVPVKNHDMFLNVMQNILGRTTKKVRAFIIGDGEDLQSLFSKCKVLNLDFTYFPEQQVKSTLTFTSWMKDVERAMAGLDIIALTSLNEGTPVSLIEAQAAQKPIISTNVGGIENVVIRNETAFLSESNDISGFSDHLLNLVESEGLRNKMIQKSRQNVENKFHYTRLVSDVKSLYGKLLENRGRF